MFCAAGPRRCGYLFSVKAILRPAARQTGHPRYWCRCECLLRRSSSSPRSVLRRRARRVDVCGLLLAGATLRLAGDTVVPVKLGRISRLSLVDRRCPSGFRLTAVRVIRRTTRWRRYRIRRSLRYRRLFRSRPIRNRFRRCLLSCDFRCRHCCGFGSDFIGGFPGAAERPIATRRIVQFASESVRIQIELC